MKKLSVIIPVYFNEYNLDPLYHKLSQVLVNNTSFDYEIIFVDDGSTDSSYKEMRKLREKDRKIKIIKLSRNFGAHTAMLAGLDNCSGDCATVLSADLQDPPDIIQEMFDKYQQGKEIVLAVRKDREESVKQKVFSNLYYFLMRKFALKNMPEGGFDCFLIDRKVIDVILSMKEKNSSLMGQVLWCGFEAEHIYYIRKEREIGVSRWTLSKKIKLFIDSFMAFSYVPIRLMSTLGIFLSIVSFIFALVVFIQKIRGEIVVEGWTTLMIVFLLVSGIQMILLGVIGEYLWRSLDESRKRPNYIIDKMEGFSNNDHE